MNIYEQLNQLLEDKNQDCEELLKELLKEIKELNRTLKKQDKSKFYRFIHRFKKEFKTANKLEITKVLHYRGKTYTILQDGLIYTMPELNRINHKLANEIFKFLYKNSKNLQKFIKDKV